MGAKLECVERPMAVLSEAEWLLLHERIDLLPERDGAIKPHFKAAANNLKKYRNRVDIRRIFGEEKGWEKRREKFNEFLKKNDLPFVLSRLVLSPGFYDAGFVRLDS